MTRRASREGNILNTLRKQITEGVLPPGSRLPLRTEFEQKYGVVTQTIQRVMSTLMREGFIVSRGRLGTFVRDRPPHLHRFGLWLRGNPADPHTWETAKFETFLYREWLAKRDRDESDLVVYTAVDNVPGIPGRQRLLDDIRAHRLAGLFCEIGWQPEEPDMSAALQEAALPCVVVGERCGLPDVTVIHLSHTEVMARALDYFQREGRRGVGLLTGLYTEEGNHRFAQMARERGLATRPYWIQGVTPNNARFAANSAHLLMQAKEAPDALFITDDVLVEHASGGLADAGVHIPRDLLVVAHCNYPHVTPSRVPARRIGFDVREVLNTGLAHLERRIHGGDAPKMVTITPRFDDEIGSWNPSSGHAGTPARRADAPRLPRS